MVKVASGKFKQTAAMAAEAAVVDPPHRSDSAAPSGLRTKASSVKNQVNSPEFKDWFKDSKVVGLDGKPLVVFHGTRDAFDQFEIGRTTKNFIWGRGMDVTRMGAFFSTEKKQAQTFTKDGGKVLPVYLSLQKPVDLYDGYPGEVWDCMGDLLREWNIHIQSPETMWELFDTGTLGGREFVSALKANGFDGARIYENGCEVWVAFEPTQIKSAAENCGAFDPANPDFRA